VKRPAGADILRTRTMLVLRAAIGFALSYAFATRAIDTGSWLQYFGAVLFLVLSIRLVVRAIRK
jgi:hypothetical protein